jgi:hypothetical protein
VKAINSEIIERQTAFFLTQIALLLNVSTRGRTVTETASVSSKTGLSPGGGVMSAIPLAS